MAAEPKCPECQARGLQYIVSAVVTAKAPEAKPQDTGLLKRITQALSDTSGHFAVVYCSHCGYIYNVLPLYVYSVSL